MGAKERTVSLLLSVMLAGAGCAAAPSGTLDAAPPSRTFDPVLVLPGVWEGRVSRWATPSRLVVEAVTPTGPDQWTARGLFLGSPASLEITRVNGTIRVTEKNEIGMALILDLFGERRLVGSLYPPADASKPMELILEK